VRLNSARTPRAGHGGVAIPRRPRVVFQFSTCYRAKGV
jgi:hypothetical protein